MNISRVSSSENNPNFGIRYNKPSKWHPEVLQALRESNVVKEIDKKYPKAVANYYVNGSTGSIRTLNFKLRNDMDIDMLACSIFAPNAVKKFCKDIKELKLADIEKHFPFKDTVYTTNQVDDLVREVEAHNCTQEEQITSPVTRFFRYIFDPDARAEYKSRKKLTNQPIDLELDCDLNIWDKGEDLIKIVEPKEIKLKKDKGAGDEILELFPVDEQP